MRGIPAAAVLLLVAASALAGDEKAKEAPKPVETRKAEPKAAEPKAAEPKKAVAAKPVPKNRREALRFLERITVSVDFDAVPLADAVAHLAAVTDTNLLIGQALRDEGDLDARKVTLRLKKVTARQALEFLVDGQSLGIGFTSGILSVTTKRDARGKPVLRLHALGDLLMPLTDFPGPDLMLKPAGAEAKVEPEEPRKGAFSDADEIMDLIKSTAGSGTWEDEGVSISKMGDFLAVKQYEEVHEEVARLLALLRATR